MKEITVTVTHLKPIYVDITQERVDSSTYVNEETGEIVNVEIREKETSSQLIGYETVYKRTDKLSNDFKF